MPTSNNFAKICSFSNVLSQIKLLENFGTTTKPCFEIEQSFFSPLVQNSGNLEVNFGKQNHQKVLLLKSYPTFDRVSSLFRRK